MGLDTKHPHFNDLTPSWSMMWDVYTGERKVKAARFNYLPPTSGMREDGLQGGQKGALAYDAYLNRAWFPDVITEAVDTSVGIMNKKPATFELPTEMEYLMKKATKEEQTLDLLLRQIHQHQLVTGRCGLLLDMDEEESAENLPYLSFYAGSKIPNWYDQLFVILDESGEVPTNDFSWVQEKKYRVLVLRNGEYQTATFRGEEIYDPIKLMAPFFRGRRLDELPFVFINSQDLLYEPSEPPLSGLAYLALSMYKQDADYKQALFMQGQDTLVTIGGNDDQVLRIGAGASINVPLGGDVKFAGVDGSGLQEQRQSLENDYQRASGKGGQLLDTTTHERESGEALTTRVAARTASLHQTAMAAAGGLQDLLRKQARWMGLDDEKVIVKPNLDFADSTGMSRALLELLAAKAQGAPISFQSIHDWMQRHDITVLNLEEEMALIRGETTTVVLPQTSPSNPNPTGSGS